MNTDPLSACAGESISPTRRQWLKRAGQYALLGGLFAGGGWTLARLTNNLWRVCRERPLMGTSVAINCLADDREAAGVAIEAAFAHMARVAGELTRFDPASPLSRLNRERVLHVVPQHLHAVLREALELSAHTQGAFDATVLPVLRYFETLRGISRLDGQNDARIAEREQLVDWRRVHLDALGVRLDTPGMAITLDGIAKGYVVDQGVATLKAHGIEYGIVDAGGDVHAFTGSDANRHWNVGIVDPLDPRRVAAVVQVRNAAISTSGNYRVFFSADRRLFHLVNPHTGFSPQGYASMTMVAARSILADGMSTAAFSLTLPQVATHTAARDLQWLAISRDGREHWRSRELPLVAGEARTA